MSSSVCQGLQSCLEPRLIEPRVFRHKFTSPKSNLSLSSQRPSGSLQEQEQEQDNSHSEDSKSSNNGDLAGWNFIQALTNMPQICKEVTPNEKAYVHPLVKHSSSTLSNKSLEMCTESLGSETGSGISESIENFSPISLENEKSLRIHRSKSQESAKKLTRSGSFPPPLTSISGSASVQVRPHREGGRLVIKAVTVASSNTLFQAERVDGRLRLCLMKDSSVSCCDNNEEVVEEHATGEYYDEDGEAIGGNSGNVGCEIENIGEFPRPSRCKEGGGRGNEGMSSWGTVLKALC